MMTQAANVTSFKGRENEIFQRARKSHSHPIAMSHVANKMATIIWYMLASRMFYNERKKVLYP